GYGPRRRHGPAPPGPDCPSGGSQSHRRGRLRPDLSTLAQQLVPPASRHAATASESGTAAWPPIGTIRPISEAWFLTYWLHGAGQPSAMRIGPAKSIWPANVDTPRASGNVRPVTRNTLRNGWP